MTEMAWLCAPTDDGPVEGVDGAFRRGARTWREMHGWSQAEVAQRMQDRGFPFHQATVWSLEAGHRPTRLSEAAALADVLEVPLTHLLGTDTERVAQFELALATQRVKDLERDAEHLQSELEQARDALATLVEAATEAS